MILCFSRDGRERHSFFDVADHCTSSNWKYDS
jgi:hypothetical protein